MSPDCFEKLDSQRICTHTCQHSMKIHTARAVFITGLAFGFSAFFKEVGYLCGVMAAAFLYLLIVCRFMSLTYLTYSADFQKCPGWERRRFLFGNFSSKSTSLEKLGRSSGLYAQQRSRISWKAKTQKKKTNYLIFFRCLCNERNRCVQFV